MGITFLHALALFYTWVFVVLVTFCLFEELQYNFHTDHMIRGAMNECQAQHS
jgi:hypothetical protein